MKLMQIYFAHYYWNIFNSNNYDSHTMVGETVD